MSLCLSLSISTCLSHPSQMVLRRIPNQIKVDFGNNIGIKQSSAQITDLYSKDDLIGKQVIAVTNFLPKKIGPFTSDCLITGFYQEDKSVVLVVPDKKILNGSLLA